MKFEQPPKPNQESEEIKIPHLSETELESKENEIPERVMEVLKGWGLDAVRELDKNKEGLKYHDSIHTGNVVEVSNKILKFFNNVSKRDKQLLTLLSVYHDAIQNWHEKEYIESEKLKNGEDNPFAGCKKVRLEREGERNEELCVSKLCKYMDNVNAINYPHVIFTDADKKEVEKIRVTEAGFNLEYGTITNGIDDGKEHSPIEIALAMADLASSGTKEPKEFIEEADKLFYEENLDIQRLAQDGIVSEKQKEYIKSRIIGWAKFQINFTKGRYKVFLEKELPQFPEDRREEVKAYFSKYEENIKAWEEETKKRENMSFEQLMKEIYGIEFTGQRQN